MSILQIKRGTTAGVGAYTPAMGEPVYNKQLKKLTIGDGTTPGGVDPALSNPNLGALNSLTGAADRLAYFTGVGAMALTPLTAVARALLDDTTVTAQRSTLGLGTAATTNVQTSSSDTTAGAALLVGAGGLLGNAIPVAESAIDTVGVNGWLNVTAAGLGKLPVNINGYLFNGKISSVGYQYQQYAPVTGGRFYWRFQVAGVWDATWSSSASAGVNTDISSLTGLTTALSISQGGTGSTTAAGARTNLGLGSAAIATIGTSGNNVPLMNTANSWSAAQAMAGATPVADGASNLGTAPLRWATVFAVTGTINTSDARLKTPVLPFTEAELAASAELGRTIGLYRWTSAVLEKGDSARSHVGMTVQSAIECLERHGLDAMSYGFICYDEWDGGNRYGFRMDELNAFLAAGFNYRLTLLEERL